jgi:hypothetical protein
MTKLTVKDAGISVVITRETRSPSQQGFGSCAFVQAVTAITNRIKKYVTLADLAVDYPVGTEAHAAAVFWFSQEPAPDEFYVIQALTTSLAVKSAGSFDLSAVANANGDGTVSFTLDGVSYSVSPAAAATPTAVGDLLAALVNAGITHTAVNVAGLVTITDITGGVLGDAVVLADTSTDTGMSGAVLTQPTGGANLVPNESTGAALTAGLAIDPSFYFVAVDRQYRVIDAQMTAAAAWTEANKRSFFGVSNDIDCLNAAVSTDIGSVFLAAGYDRSMVAYSSRPIEYSDIAAAAILASTDFDGTDTIKTLKYKTFEGVTSEDVSPTQLAALKGKNLNVSYTVAGIKMFDEGKNSSGVFCDSIHGSDALAEAIKVGVFGALVSTTTKIAYTEKGMAVLKSKTETALLQFLNNGFIAESVDSNGDFVAAYTVTSDPVSAASVANKAARIAPAIAFTARESSAVHEASINGVIKLP